MSGVVGTLTGRIRLIQVAKRQLGMDDATYREMLLSVAGVASSKECTPRQLDAVIEHLKRCGFQPSTPFSPVDPQVAKLESLWRELHTCGVVRSPTRQSLNAYVAKVARVDDVAWLSTAAASRVIEQLKKWLARVKLEASCT